MKRSTIDFVLTHRLRILRHTHFEPARRRQFRCIIVYVQQHQLNHCVIRIDISISLIIVLHIHMYVEELLATIAIKDRSSD